MKRFFLTALLVVLCFSNNAFAQKQLIIEHNYSSFSDIYANDFFDITIVPSSSYSVKLITDTSMEDFVQAYVKDDAIVLHLDTKGMPKEVRKAFFDAWNGKPRITAEVQMPFVRKVTLDGDSSICSVACVCASTFSAAVSFASCGFLPHDVRENIIIPVSNIAVNLFI